MSNINTISKVEAKLFKKALKSFEAELQATIDFKESMKTESINQDGCSVEAVAIRESLTREIAEHKKTLDEVFACNFKINSILNLHVANLRRANLK